MQRVTTYSPIPISFERGEGVWLWDEKGQSYLDALSGIAVCILGHSHPIIIQALCEQAKKLMHTSNGVEIKWQKNLAEKLAKLTPMEQMFFANSGAEANETALKVARLFGHKKNIATPHVIVTEGAFHGRTLATLSASGSRRVQAGFEPLVQGYIRVPYNDLEAVSRVAHTHEDVVAIMVEPVQGENGIKVPNPGYLQGLRELCDKHNWLLILDEIQTGLGRTGKLFAFEHEQIVPDILTSAKGLGNGYPISVCMMKGPASNLLTVGSHGSTFGGNPLACCVAYHVLEVIMEENLIDKSAKVSQYLLQQFKAHLKESYIKDIRAKGLMIGVELDRPCKDILPIAAKHGLLFNIAAEKTMRFLPALIFTNAHVDVLIERLKKTLDEYYSTR